MSNFGRLFVALCLLLSLGAAQLASAAHLAGHPPVEQSQVHAIHAHAGGNHFHVDRAAQDHADDDLPGGEEQQPMHSHIGLSSIALADVPPVATVTDQVGPDSVTLARSSDAQLIGSPASLQERPPRTV